MAPGFHRHVLITPGDGTVSAWVEDDYHHMGVTLRHDGVAISRVEADMVRAPWSTCPGAVAQLEATFTGVALSAVARRGEKTTNCTHLHDMAVIAAAHAHDATPTRYAIAVSDAVAGERVAAISRDGETVLRLIERDGVLVDPPGRTLFELGEWIATLDPPMREAARMLRWGRSSRTVVRLHLNGSPTRRGCRRPASRSSRGARNAQCGSGGSWTFRATGRDR